MCAAMLTLGGLHAPLLQTYDLLVQDDPLSTVNHLIEHGRRVPGWGNSLVKGRPDPLWEECALALSDASPSVHNTIADITQCLHACGKLVYPNASCLTAACAIALNLQRSVLPYLLLNGRLKAWTSEYLRVVQEARLG